jgi:hypothetical protein
MRQSVKGKIGAPIPGDGVGATDLRPAQVLVGVVPA